ncbi:MAG TPA: M56 family metallopeptidase [Flavisolibacter sp.]
MQLILIGQSADNYLEEFVVTSNQQFSMQTILGVIYGIVSLLFILLLIYSILRIFSIIRSHTISFFDKVKFINTDVQGAPFSFLNYIVWKQDISLETEVGQQIFQHEMVHVNEKHTWDKLFMQVIIAIFWCNPFFWLIRKELKFIHEFIADKKAVGEAGTEAFAAMILQTVYSQKFQTITNQFFQTSIKRRIFMLTQVKNPKVAYAGRIAALPIVALLIFSFTVRTNHAPEDKLPFQLAFAGSNDTLPKKGKEISSVDVNSAKKLITITYADGTVEKLTERQAMEKGIINNDFSNRKDSGRATGSKASIRIKGGTASPLFILDDQEVSKEAIENLDPKRIESVNVLKDASATSVYGEKGKNGVVEIKTKSKPSGEPLSLQQNGKEMLSGKITSVEVDKNKISVDASEVTVIGYKKQTSGTAEPVFEKAEFTPTVDRDEWRAFLEKYTISFIEEATSKGMPEGKYTIMVKFLVEKDGTLSNFSILNDPGYGLGSKVLEMMKHAPRWKPAIQNQKVVRSYHTQPITFQIQESEPDVSFNNKGATKN